MRRLRSELFAFHAQWDRAHPPEPDVDADHGRWTGEALAFFDRTDNLALVAGMRAGQAKKLKATGIATRTALGSSSLARVPKMADETFMKLRAQASLQVASDGAQTPEFKVIASPEDGRRRGLALLPPSSSGDVFFDMEGYPLEEGGLEYLFGAVVHEGGQNRFFDWWGHDRTGEKVAFEGFIDWIVERRAADPQMHVYHYHHYEPVALKRLMGLHGTREREIDDLLRGGVFIDLYKVVREGVRVGTSGYSLKDLERLYREKRSGDVQTAAGSVAMYGRWIESGESRDWRESPRLASIRDYNCDDCDSTVGLAMWLRERALENGIAYQPPPAPDPARAQAIQDRALTSQAQISRDLYAIAQAEPATVPTSKLLAELCEFHQREARPTHWAMFDRHASTEEELAEDIACLAGLERVSDRGVAVARSVVFDYRIAIEQDCKLQPDDDCYFAHDLQLSATIFDIDVDRDSARIKFSARTLQALGGLPPSRLSLIPNEYVGADAIQDAVRRVGARWRDARAMSGALETLLMRRPPRINGYPGGPLVRADETTSNGVVRITRSMLETTLVIQGPPGTGKTHTAAEAILALVADGKTVGVASNSHKAITNVLAKCAELNGGRINCLKVGGDRNDPFLQTPGAEYVATKDVAGRLAQVRLVGGTAWAFSDPTLADRFDYLFVDEAGQVALANVVGMSQSARNLVLLGDQMQLGQPTKGAHPGESGLSALDYMLGDLATVPPDRGVFLETTRRLHPDLCEFISSAVYEGRLSSLPECANRVVRVPAGNRGGVAIEAGLLFVPVAHEGNAQASDEEVTAIQTLVGDLIGRNVTDENGNDVGTLGLNEILFVAPYNAQVARLTAALPPGARVGTVDKFQGQEARVVIVSMGASDATESSRGLAFLLDKNRLNVALSRAQSLAIVVASPKLARATTSSLAQMTLVNLFCRITDATGSGTSG
jgi:uncharacterized protein